MLLLKGIVPVRDIRALKKIGVCMRVDHRVLSGCTYALFRLTERDGEYRFRFRSVETIQHRIHENLELDIEGDSVHVWTYWVREVLADGSCRLQWDEVAVVPVTRIKK